MTSQEIVKIIEAELKKKGITKETFYRDVGIKAGNMSNWRTGNNNPSLSTLARISEYLGLDLMGARGPEKESGIGRYGLTKAEWKSIGSLFSTQLSAIAKAPEWLVQADAGMDLDEIKAFLAGENQISAKQIRALAAYMDRKLYQVIGAYAMAFDRKDDSGDESYVDMAEVAEVYRNRPNMRILFNLTKKTTEKTVGSLVDFLKGLEQNDETD